MKQQIALLILAAICQLVLTEAALISLKCAFGNLSACSRSKTRDYYDGINTYLRQNVKTEDVNKTMSAVADWIQRESSRKLNYKDAQRLKALIQLHNLVQTEGPGTCTLSSSRLLQNNDLAVGGAISKLSPGEIPKRKVERLINHYATQFLRDCDHEKMVKKVSPEHMTYIESIISDYISMRVREDSPFTIFHAGLLESVSIVDYAPYVASNFAKGMKGIKEPRDAIFIRRWLLKLGTEKLDASIMCLNKGGPVDGRAVFKIYRKYVGKPCEEFIEKVENSFGSPWALDQFKKIHKRLDTEDPFYTHLTYYYGCGLLLHNEERLIEGLKQVIADQ